MTYATRKDEIEWNGLPLIVEYWPDDGHLTDVLAVVGYKNVRLPDGTYVQRPVYKTITHIFTDRALEDIEQAVIDQRRA